MQKEVAVADLHHPVPPPDLHPQGLVQAHLDQGVHAAAQQEDRLRQVVDL